MHADNNNPPMVKGMNMLGTTLDKALDAFLTDLSNRGLSEDVLLVVTGDFGRTPTVNKKGGRDHWARLGTLAFAGGGLPMGQIIGSADKRNGEPASEPVDPAMMMGTIPHTLFDIGKLRVARGLTTDLQDLSMDCDPSQLSLVLNCYTMGLAFIRIAWQVSLVNNTHARESNYSISAKYSQT